MPARLQVLTSSIACLSLTLASLPVALFGGASSALAAPADDDDAAAREAYDEGEKAYRLGKFEEAAVAFERAYELSGLPDILYNIGLSHLRWYDVDPDVAHLRKAKVVFQNYVIEIQKNPELGDLDEAEALITQIDEKIATAEPAAGDDPEQPPSTDVPIDYGPDPGKKLRLGGMIAMSAGGLLVVGGVVSGVVLGLRGQEFEEQLAVEYDQFYAVEMCTTDDARPECDAINDRIDYYYGSGRRANALAVGLGLGLGGLGLIGVVTGAVLFVKGNKKTRHWKERQLVVTPVWQPGASGLSLSGRF